jgi:hypothetical protein
MVGLEIGEVESRWFRGTDVERCCSFAEFGDLIAFFLDL